VGTELFVIAVLKDKFDRVAMTAKDAAPSEGEQHKDGAVLAGPMCAIPPGGQDERKLVSTANFISSQVSPQISP
jgi:hypothetical protein